MADFNIEGVTGTLILLCLAVLSTITAVVLLYMWTAPVRSRVSVRLLRVTALTLSPFFAIWLWFECEQVHSHGKWRCAVCAFGEERDELLGIVVRRGPETSGSEDEHTAAQAFHEWYAAHFPGPHRHLWISVGCHYSAGGVGCSFYPSRDWYVALPRVPDLELARHLLARVERSDPIPARHLLYGFDGEIWTRLASGESMPNEEVSKGIDAWLAEHPEWR